MMHSNDPTDKYENKSSYSDFIGELDPRAKENLFQRSIKSFSPARAEKQSPSLSPDKQ